MSEVPLYLTVGSQVGEREREREGGGGIQKILKVIYIFQVMRLCLNRCVDLE